MKVVVPAKGNDRLKVDGTETQSSGFGVQSRANETAGSAMFSQRGSKQARPPRLISDLVDIVRDSDYQLLRMDD